MHSCIFFPAELKFCFVCFKSLYRCKHSAILSAVVSPYHDFFMLPAAQATRLGPCGPRTSDVNSLSSDVQRWHVDGCFRNEHLSQGRIEQKHVPEWDLYVQPHGCTSREGCCIYLIYLTFFAPKSLYLFSFSFSYPLVRETLFTCLLCDQ